LTLTGGLPTGGTYFGSNISGGQFNPQTAGGGSHTINYTYSDGNGCSDTASQTIVVDTVTQVSLTKVGSLCANSDSITLSGATPLGGAYSLNGDTITGFNPKTRGKGKYTIWYSYTNLKGCVDSLSDTIRVDSVTPLSYPSLSSICNGVNPVAINTATPVGGQYSGMGVVNDTLFDPGLTGNGTFVIQYKFTNGYGCKDSITQSIGVDTLPGVSFSLSRDSICSNGDSIQLQGQPMGGVFSGLGVLNNYFNPVNSGKGWQVISYGVTGANGCSNSAIDSIRVDSVTVLQFNLIDSICRNGQPVSLMASPMGGVFSGHGVSGSTYTPGLTTNQQDSIQYKFSNGFGCKDSVIEAIRVDSVPKVSITSLPKICSKDSLVLTQGTPLGGQYSGVGVLGNVFNPNNVGGKYPIVYSYSNQYGCRDSIKDTIEVYQNVRAQLSGLGTICANEPDFSLKNGLPVGGKYLGGMIKTDSVFSAIQVGRGQHSLQYAVRDSNGCVDTATMQVIIDSVPVVRFALIPALCSQQGDYTLIEGTPKGGIYSGQGVKNDTLFDPSIGYGNYTVGYRFTDSKGCFDSVNSQIQVDTLLTAKSAVQNDICAYGDTIRLNDGLPSGGVFVGDGVINDTNYVTSKAGLDSIYYKVTSYCGVDSVLATIKVNALPQVSISAIPVMCELQGKHTLTEGLPLGGTYFVDGIPGNIISDSKTGEVGVVYQFTDSLGCVGVAEQKVMVKAKPQVQVSGETTICSKDSLKLSTEGQYKHVIWNGDTLDGNYELPPHLTTYGESNVALRVVDTDGCVNNSSVEILVKNCGNPMEVFPNPSEGEFQMRFLSDTEKKIEITITNSIGQAILEESPMLVPGSNLFDVVVPLGAGTYIIKVEMDGNLYWEKIVVR
jgi:hypothetical protein